MSDIKLTDGEIVLGYEDFELVSDSDCMLQDVRSLLFTDKGALFYDETYGSGVLRFIHADNSDTMIQELKQSVKIALKTDERIIQNSIAVAAETSGETLDITISFTATDGEDYTLEETL